MGFFKTFTTSSRGITIGLGILKVIKVMASLLTIILSAQYFGTSIERDAWILGGTIIAVIIQLFFGPINETFRAKYIHIREEQSVNEADEITMHLISGFAIVCILISGIIYFFPNIISQLFAPGFSKVQTEVLVLMVKILIPSLLIIQITNIWTSVLNAYSSFYLPELFSFVSVILNIVLLITISPYVGIYSLVISSYISSILLIIVIHRELRLKFNYKFTFVWPKLSLLKPFIIFSLPLYVSYFFSQSDTIVEKALISNMLQGSISILDYAKRFSDLSISMIISIITTVLTPVLAFAFTKKDHTGVIIETQKYFRMMSLVVIPLSVMFIVVPKEIITVLLLRGAFDIENVEITATLLRYYGLGIFFSTVYVVYSQVLIAQKRIYIFSAFLISIYIVKIILNFLLYKIFGLVTFPISWCIAYFLLSTVFMYISVKDGREKILKDGGKIYMVLILSILINMIIYNFISTYLSSYQLLFLFGILVLTVELLLIMVFKVDEYKTLLTIINKKTK